MKLQRTERFKKDFNRLSRSVQERALKQLALFLEDPRHRSLRVKKMKGHAEIWETRVTRSYRFTFQIREDAIILRRIGTHDILKTP